MTSIQVLQCIAGFGIGMGISCLIALVIEHRQNKFVPRKNVMGDDIPFGPYYGKTFAQVAYRPKVRVIECKVEEMTMTQVCNELGRKIKIIKSGGM